MTTASFAILAVTLLSVVTADSLESSHCNVDHRLTPSDDVLIGRDTPVYFLTANASSNSDLTFRPQRHVMAELENKLPVYPELANGKTNIEVECRETAFKWYQKDVLGPLECATPDTIYPKIVIIVDYPMYQHYGNTTNLIKFLMAYWNGVDVLYRTLEHPKLRFHIAGIIIAEEPDVLPFLTHNKISDMYEYTSVPIGLGQFMEIEGASWSFYFGYYHMAAFMTTKKLCAKFGKACRRTDILESSRDMCTEIRDNGPPARVVISVDEHWMKMYQTAITIENTLKPRELRGEKSICSQNDNAVTQYAQNLINDLPDWSECYLNSFKKRFNKANTSCFYRKPKVTFPLPRLQLGRLFPGKIQCTNMNMGDFCMSESICKNLQCMDKKTNSCKPANVPAADGTICGPEKICYRRKCVYVKDV